MNVFKIEVLLIDFDELGEAEARREIENARYPNDCLSLQVKSIEARQIEWSDDHPLNKRSTADEEYRRLFAVAAK